MYESQASLAAELTKEAGNGQNVGRTVEAAEQTEEVHAA
jgi:hypothetical protein